MLTKIARFLLVSLLLSPCIATITFIEPFPVSDCSGTLTNGGSSCPNQPGCCAGGAACCAGGCCPLTAWCVKQGSPNEGCCPLGDPTNCGAVVPTYTLPACGVARPSKQCVSADDDWYCPPGSSCGSRYGSCFGGGGDSCTTVVGGSTESSLTTPPESSGSVSSGGAGGSGSGRGGGSSATPAQVGNNAKGSRRPHGRFWMLLGAEVGALFVIAVWA